MSKQRRQWYAIHWDFIEDLGESLLLDLLRYDRMTVEMRHRRDSHTWWVFSTDGRIETKRLESFGLREPTLDKPGSLFLLGEWSDQHAAVAQLDNKVREIENARSRLEAHRAKAEAKWRRRARRSCGEERDDQS